MPPHDSFADVMARLRAGDEDAAAEIFHRFTHRLVALARKKLDSRVRQKVDPEDVLQSVYKSFFLRHAQGKLDPANWDSLWALLVVITVYKCGRWRRYFHAQGRDVDAEVVPQSAADQPGIIEAFSREPSPEEAVMLSEVVEQLLRDLGPRDSAILTLALQRYSAAEISDQLDRPPRTVYRVLDWIKKRLQAALGETSS